MDASASRVNLFLKCGYWARPDILGPPNESGPGAHYGIAVHSLTEALSKPGTIIDYDAISKQHDLTSQQINQAKADAFALYTWHQKHIGGQKYHEQKVAFNTKTRTARVLTKPEPRDYSECSPEEFPGTADLISVKDDAACVIDYKTGHTPWEIYKDQLNFLGLAASKIYERSRIVCIVLKVSNGECYPHYWVLDQQKLDEFENKFVSAFERVPECEPSPGPHCISLYCPLAGTCPATLGKLQPETGGELTRSIDTECSIKDDEHANRLYEIKSLLTKTSKIVSLSLKQYVDKTGGFVLPNGKTYKKDKGSYKETRVQENNTDE
jgi:hypothetical protein